MLIEIGHFALVLALIFSILLVVLPSIGIYQNKSSLAQLSKPLVWGQCFWITVAFFVLMSAFLTNDFSVKYVSQNSNTQLHQSQCIDHVTSVCAKAADRVVRYERVTERTLAQGPCPCLK